MNQLQAGENIMHSEGPYMTPIITGFDHPTSDKHRPLSDPIIVKYAIIKDNK